MVDRTYTDESLEFLERVYTSQKWPGSAQAVLSSACSWCPSNTARVDPAQLGEFWSPQCAMAYLDSASRPL